MVKKQRTQTLIVRLLKTHFSTPIFDCEKSTERIELVTRPCASDTPAVSPSFPLTPLRRCVRVLFVATLTRLH